MAHVEHQHPGTRRDFLFVATGAAGGIATAAAVWPLINQMNPSADVQALASIQVDVSGVAEGSQITVKFLGKPVFIRHRTADEIAAAQGGRPARPARPAGAQPEHRRRRAARPTRTGCCPARENWMVMIGVCTHLGCVPLSDAGEFNAWFCPCHGSTYDTAGRIRSGPAPENLHIPVASFVSDTVIQLG